MPNIQLMPLVAGDRVGHVAGTMRYGRIAKIEGKYAVVHWENGGEEWIHVHMLCCSPSEDEIYGRLAQEIQAEWSDAERKRRNCHKPRPVEMYRACWDSHRAYKHYSETEFSGQVSSAG